MAVKRSHLCRSKRTYLGEFVPQGFEQLVAQRISYNITPNSQQRMALLQMTPFAWRANEGIQQALSSISELEIETILF